MNSEAAAPEVCSECNGTGEGYTAQHPCATCGAFMTRSKNYPTKWAVDFTDEERYVYQYPPRYRNRHERRRRAKELRRRDGKSMR